MTQHDHTAHARLILAEAERAASAAVWRLTATFESLSPRAPSALRERVRRELATAMDTWRAAVADLRAYDRRHPPRWHGTSPRARGREAAASGQSTN